MKDVIANILHTQPNLTGREIAKILGVEKKEVNSFLDKNQEYFFKDDNFRWSIISSISEIEVPKKVENLIMQHEHEISNFAKNRLIQLLDYVSHQAEDTQKTQYEINGNRFYSYDLKKLRGLKILNDSDWWFQIERLQLQSMPIPSKQLSLHIHVETEKVPTFNYASLNKLVSFKRVDHLRLAYFLVANDLITKIGIIQKLFKEFENYRNNWELWKQDNDEIKKSIIVYDKLFSWNTAINLGGTGDGEEIVAGFGLVDWVLPTTQKSYSYPLITIPLEMEIEKNGLIRVGAKDTRANIEMDAILLEDDIPTSGQVKLALKENLDNGRSLALFEGETYSDLVEAFVANIFSRGTIVEAENRAIPSKNLTVTLTSVLFSRPKRNSILSDDIELLKTRLNDPSVIIPEQPLSLVTELSNNINKKETYSFRGRSGTEGFGSKVEELYFPLPYNKEQITIVQNLLTSSGVVVQGPPGTGKTHSIANIICHYLANGKKVLVTAQQSHVLKTVHEKIPDELKPLVVSRIGSSKESKNQLESSIDLIVQKITQMNVGEVQRTIEVLKQQVDHNHHEMALIDREIYNFAEKHYQNIEVDGNKKLPMDIVKTVLESRASYEWFTDQLTLENKDQFPFSQIELIQLRDSRKKIGTDLPFINYGSLPVPERLLDSTSLKKLSEFLKEKDEIEEFLKKNDKHSFKEITSEVEINELRDWLKIYLEDLNLVLDHAEPWLLSYFKKINSEDKGMELDIYTNLIQEVQPLVEYRKSLLTDPIELNFEIQPNSKEYQAVQRAVDIGKPFNWYHFGTAELQELFKSIKVSGKYPDTSDEWKRVKEYIDRRQTLNVFMSKWNSIAAQLDIPLIELNNRGIDEILKEFTQLIIRTQKCLDLKNKYLDVFSANYLKVFSRAKSFDFYGLPKNIDDLIQLLGQKLKIFNLEVYQQQLADQILYLSEFDNKISNQLKKIVSQVDSDSLYENELREYADLLKKLAHLKDLTEDFDRVKLASIKLSQTNAVILSKDILEIPYAQEIEDPILRNTLVEAWEWKRLETFVMTISNTSRIENLYERRRIHEKNLSQNYAQLAANKTWLALKENASDKILVALQRYKIAVQHYGKGTGKNAPRYRKDAQAALKEATAAIPCWVMSHLQVSESMPAELGLFDLVIVDEASQSSIDVLPVLMRAKKLLVVGDNKQVSPSNVGLASAQIDVLRNRYLHGQPHAAYLTPDMSLYDMASSIYESSVMLLEHFRCHPAIISYSNKNFYGNRIKPMRLSKKSEQLSPALVAIYTPQGYRESKNSKHINRIEAKAIIEEMKLLLKDERYANRSIGVISLLGPAQAEFIQSEALNEFGAGALTQVQFACGDASAFQGAERDIIFLSMVADPQNCHALSRSDHEQRFNVAASRARERMYLVHSVSGDHISPKDLRLNLLNHFYDLQEDQKASFEAKLELCESEFEKSVFMVLHKMGYTVTPQVKVGSYRIDLVVESDGDQRLAVECDGDSYHGPEQWHDDMIRQRALERAGWTFWRCFASSWSIERENMVQSLIEKLNAMSIKPTNHASSLIQDVEQRVWVNKEPEENVIQKVQQDLFILN
ncbi:AAA domain-containing protein [Acinetobacter faecalis]|uniref:AAA domain-containing protein n=2 Tax=Acinetobacter TaxID=469 RepID=A0ABU5GLD0_9GAMM|nr:AAA domain-containing protein [Acinetobacter faecalis]MDY6551183.1 AAA domain-containing protein [Acinetobacter faecalis]